MIPLTARCFIPSVLSHVSDTVATSADILAAHATMVAPFGVTIYDYELTHSVPPRRTSDAFHSFITADEQRNQLYFYCHTRKTYMPRSQRLGLLKMQNQAHTLHHGCDDAAGEALAQLPLFDTNILVVVTGESCMGTLRAAMSAFIDSVPPDEALTPSHAELLYAQLRSVMTLPFTVTPTVVGSSRRFEFTPAPDSTGEDAPTAHLTVVVVGGKTICLQPAGRHSWERIPTVDWAPPDTTNGPADPVVPSSFLPARFARGGSASRRIVSYWTCPSCKRTSPNVSRAVGADSGPTHWCLSCRCCNLCVVKDAPPARTRPDSSEPGASFASLMTQPCSSPLPHQDVDLSILFSRLDTRNVINVLLAIMCHQAVLVVCEDLGILADVIAGFLSLLHPFKSEKNVVPVSTPSSVFLLHAAFYLHSLPADRLQILPYENVPGVSFPCPDGHNSIFFAVRG